MDVLRKFQEIVIRLEHPTYAYNISEVRKEEFVKWRNFLFDLLSNDERMIIIYERWDRNSIHLYSNFCRCCWKQNHSAASDYVWCIDCLIRKEDSLCQYNYRQDLVHLEQQKQYNVQYKVIDNRSAIAILQSFLFENFKIETIPPTTQAGYTTTVEALSPTLPATIDKAICKKKYYGIQCSCGDCPQQKPHSRFIIQ